ncbi:Isopropylmalate dehydrogenase-like domain [Aspergillus oryzae]|uniref:Isopropylmalate dehydrogenase-like domain n=1 Tax=Aspergillus oryzae TaxID=5062 RepID=A0A1S9DIK9_ASPOZ|nr:Isopropylmalate dehydrogenase-like domain [Aspergillus oryzae]
MKTYNIASIPADGIGPEVISAGVTVLNALAEKLNTFKLDFTHYDWSSETYKTTGKYIPDGGLEDLKRHDAILFGAVGAPDQRGAPPRPAHVREMANILLLKRGFSDTPTTVGENWVYTFIKRREELKTQFSRRYNYQRAKCEDPKLLREWFERVQITIMQYGIQPDDIYNFDETGFAMGLISTAKVVTRAELAGRPFLLQPGNREWVTSIECISSRGPLPPCLIFKGKVHIEGWYEMGLPSDWRIETSANGWTTDEIGLRWLQQLFIPFTAGHVPDHISLWGLRLSICQPLQQYANVRPTRVLRGTQSPLRNCPPGKLDWVIVRENSEGEYAGQGGRSHRGFPWEVATETAIFSRHGVERIMRFAFETAAKRPRKLLTVVTKSNAQRNGMVLWDEVATEVGKEFPEVQVDKMLVDAMTTRMVLKPETLDTIVASNLHADILSDLAAALAGSIGIAPTSNLDPTRQHPSMFEPIHGSAFDITGKGIANPVATFWTAAEMLAWLGEETAAQKLMECVENVCERGILTADLGGKATTKEVTEAMVGEIQRL